MKSPPPTDTGEYGRRIAEFALAGPTARDSRPSAASTRIPCPALERRPQFEEAAEQLRSFFRTSGYQPGDRFPPKPALRQFADFRAAIEYHAARLASALARPSDISELKRLLEAMEADDLPPGDLLERDAAFHLRIVAITGNRLMADVMTLLRAYLLESMRCAARQPRDHRLARRQHREIFEAIRRGDESGAEQAMRTHMASFQRRLAANHRKDAASAAKRKTTVKDAG